MLELLRLIISYIGVTISYVGLKYFFHLALGGFHTNKHLKSVISETIYLQTFNFHKMIFQPFFLIIHLFSRNL